MWPERRAAIVPAHDSEAGTLYDPRSMIALFILSCGVAADATAVAIAASLRGITFARGVALACAFGFAQAFMAGVGWFGGAVLGDLWSAWDHWIALALLSVVGVKMIREALAADEERAPVVGGVRSIVLLSIATSIDALAVGVSLPALGTGAPLALGMIGIVTLLFTAAGAAFGRFLGQRFGRVMEILGGAALIGIGVKIVFDHLG
jgi:putative Mn2+ efflux pump MntP